MSWTGKQGQYLPSLRALRRLISVASRHRTAPKATRYWMPRFPTTSDPTLTTSRLEALLALRKICRSFASAVHGIRGPSPGARRFMYMYLPVSFWVIGSERVTITHLRVRLKASKTMCISRSGTRGALAVRCQRLLGNANAVRTVGYRSC